MSKLELSNMYNEIGNYYDGLDIGDNPEMWSKKLPIKLEDIAHVYDDMAMRDGGFSHELDEYQLG